jgi:hypothetical protein
MRSFGGWQTTTIHGSSWWLVSPRPDFEIEKVKKEVSFQPTYLNTRKQLKDKM